MEQTWYLNLSSSFIFSISQSTFRLYLTPFRVGFSHLREHKFKHNFQDTLNPLCPCSLEAEDTYHFFMRCQNFSNQRDVLFHDLNSINSEILKMSENEVVQVLLFGHKSFSKDMDFKIFTSSIHFIKDSKIFDESLSSWEKHFWYIYTGIKNWKYFFTFYLLWRAVRYRFCVCIVLYISFFKFSVVCRCVCYDVDKGNDKMCKQ